MIGRLNRQKDPVTFVRAANLLSTRFPQMRFSWSGRSARRVARAGSERGSRPFAPEIKVRLLGLSVRTWTGSRGCRLRHAHLAVRGWVAASSSYARRDSVVARLWMECGKLCYQVNEAGLLYPPRTLKHSPKPPRDCCRCASGGSTR